MLLKNPKWEKFCLHFAQTGNAAESCKAAGYKCKNNKVASANANRLLKIDSIQARLAELHKEFSSDQIANAAEVQQRLTRILRMEETEDQVVVEAWGEGMSKARIIKKRPQLKDVIRAGELLAKMQGAFEIGVNLQVSVPVFSGVDELAD